MTYPITSGTDQPGFVPNEGGNWSGQKGTNPYWKQTLAEYMASMWANPENREKVLEIISPTWLSAKFGEPDPSDQFGKWSDRTLLAFSRWASEYQPGWSPYIDQVLPYVPPGPNDFVESPEQTAARIAGKAQLDQTAESRRQFDVTARAGNYNDWFQNMLDMYATQASMYGDQESERGTNLRHAGDLSMLLQQAFDARTKSALDQRADPGDYIRAEYEARALNPPEGTTSPAYKDVDSLADVIRRLIEYKPAEAPAAPVQRPYVEDPAIAFKAESATSTPAAPWVPPVPSASAPAQQPIQPIQYPNVPAYVNNRPPPQGNYGPGSGAGTVIMPDGTVRSQGNLAGFARGITGTRDRKFISGDPQVGQRANPELIEVKNPGPKTTVDVTPIQKVTMAKLKGKRMYANGTDDATITTYPDSVYQDQPRQKYLQGGSARDYGRLATGFAGAAFGQKVPESGRLNYGKFLNIADDPIALALMAADYKSANRDVFSVAARAKARAPLGSSINTSMVRY